jgi:shikimate kinase
MNARRPIYESLADLKIDVSEKSVEEIVSEIVDSL